MWVGRGGARKTATALMALLVLGGCSPQPIVAPPRASTPPSATETARPSAAPSTIPTPARTPTAKPTLRPVLASDGRPREARLTIPALGLERLRVRHYRGSPDDALGTRIQNGGILASPYGPDGGTGLGGIGNYIITGHRTSHTRPFAQLPRLRKGAVVHLVAGGKRYTYKIVATRRTSFRSKKSLAQQSAAVPGRIDAKPTKAMITLSTCRTPEDRAEGNNWSDQFGNPEHRIDKIGELVAIRPA
jgi:sortase A